MYNTIILSIVKKLFQITYQGYIFLGYRTNYIRFNICIKIGTYLLAAILFIVQTASWPTCWRLRLRKITYFKRVLGIIERENIPRAFYICWTKRVKEDFSKSCCNYFWHNDAKHFQSSKESVEFYFPKSRTWEFY